jgi:hypothetical protein
MSFEDEGFQLEPQLFSPEDVEALNEGLNRMWARPPRGLTIDSIETGRRMLLSEATPETRSGRYKINDAYLESATLRRLLAKLGAKVEAFLGAKGCIINSLHFERGSEQGLHTDLSYMPGHAPGQMCAAWVALEDVHELAGPLVYFPGSHTLKPHLDYWATPPDERIRRAEECMAAYWPQLGDAELNVGQRAGDVFFWHEGLIHGGAPIADKARTRRSIVVHFWAEQVVGSDVAIPITKRMSYFGRAHQPVSPTTPAYTRSV